MATTKAGAVTIAPASRVTINRTYRHLGLLNGLFLGLSLAVGAWAWDAIRLADIPVPLQYPSLIMSSLILIGLCMLVGWLTGSWQRTSLILLFWLVTAVIVTLIIGYQPFYGRTLAVWFVDRRFWGWPIYPPPEGLAPWMVIFAGFFVLLLLSMMGLLQSYRLEGVSREIGENGRLLPLAWLLLLLPVPFALGAGYITTNIGGDTSAHAIQIVHQAIQKGRTYDGDLFALGLADGINYSAIRGVRDQMSDRYTLAVGGIDVDSSSIFVIAYFDNGTWVSCRVINEQLSFCADAAAPYTIGFASLVTGETMPESCLGCMPQVADGWRDWLQARQSQLLAPLRIARLAQWGSYVLMQAEAQPGQAAVQCWFHGFSPVQLERCAEVK